MIYLIGQKHWCTHLAQILEIEPDLNPLVLSQYLRRNDMPKKGGGKPSLVARIGFRPGGKPWRGRAFDSLWEIAWRRWGKPRELVYWIGTDVQKTLAEGGPSCSPMTRRATHWGAAPWLAKELASVGVPATSVLFPDNLDTTTLPTPLPGIERVLTYLRPGREQFYGSDMITVAAQRFPDVEFAIAGTNKRWRSDLPSNIRFLGWIDMPSEIERSTIVLRLTAHDALSSVIREAMAGGRHIICTLPFEGCVHVAYADSAGLVQNLEMLFSLPHAQRQGMVNDAWQVARDQLGAQTRTLFTEAVRRLAA